MVRATIIDDSVTYRTVLARALGGVGVSVIGTAGDGITGAEAIRVMRPDLVLLDYSMPELSGIGVLERIADLDPAPAVVFLSADLTPQLAARACGLGAVIARSKAVPVADIAQDALAAVAARR